MTTLVTAIRRGDSVSRQGHGSGGFTLIELVVVMAVIAAITTAVVIGIGNIRGASVQAESGKLTLAIRYLYNLSVLNGKNYRLVIDIDNSVYWGEEQSSRDPCKAFMLPGEGEEPGGGTAEGEDKPQTAGFGAARSKLVKKRKLAKGIIFGGVMTSHQNELSTSGQAHINFFPNGTAEAAMVYVQDKGDEEDVMSVEVLAMQGTARIYNNKRDLQDFFDKG